MRRLVLGLGLALAVLAGCGVHSNIECSDGIPCPDGMVCSDDGFCVLVLPEDAPDDGPVGLDGAPDALPDGEGVCGDGVCLGSETCISCEADCGRCPFSCGDGACQLELGEDCLLCPVDCGECPGMCGDGLCQ